MPTTEIRVLGSASTSRVPDYAEVRLQVSRWGREWNSTHQAVTAAANELIDVIKRLITKNPRALEEPAVAQISQKSWSDETGIAYSESVTVTVVFSDFQVMSRWILLSHQTLHVLGIDWKLSPETHERLSILLSIEAVRDARKKAEVFAAAAGLAITGLQTLSDPRTETGANPAPSTEPAPAPEKGTAGRSDSPGGDIIISPTPVNMEVNIAAYFLASPESDQSEYAPGAQPADPFADQY